LGRRIIAPVAEEDNESALREAALVALTEKEFLEKYDGSPIPAEKIAHNVLEQMGVPLAATKRMKLTLWRDRWSATGRKNAG